MLRDRMLSWLHNLLSRFWVAILLFGLTASSLIFSLERARWVDDHRTLSTALVMGFLVGWLLARSHFRGWFAALYTLVMAFIAAVNGSAQIIPSVNIIRSSSWFTILDGINLQMYEFFLRVSGWIDILRGGNNVEDPGLFVLTVGFVLFLAGAWMTWKIFREKRALEGLLPVGGLLALNVHLSRQDLTSYWLFLLCSILWIAKSVFDRQLNDWESRRVDYSDQLGLEWGGVAMAAAVVITLLARAAPLFGTSEGWQMIADWVERARQNTSNTAERLFSGANSPPPSPADKNLIQANTPDLGEIGRQIAQGAETIMWVKTSDPAPLRPEVKNQAGGSVETERVHYWRSSIFSRYTGIGWGHVETSSILTQQDDLPAVPPSGRYFLRQDFEIVSLHSGHLFSANDAIQTSQGVQLRGVSPDAGYLVEGQANRYQVISQVTQVTADQLSNASVDYSEELRSVYLQLPDTLPERVRRLAGRIAGDGSPYDKAQRIQNYLRMNYSYDLTVDPAPDGRDAVDYFLFDSQKGFCSHYATAMAVMLRSQGVPARVVTGYATGEYDYSRGAFRVPESAAHAWVEVFFSGYDWVEFEPTAARAPFVYQEGTPVDMGEPGVVAIDRDSIQHGQTWLFYGMIALAVALLVFPIILLRLFTVSRKPPVVQVNLLYQQVRRVLSWAGLKATASVTPDEFLAISAPSLSRYRQLHLALSQVTGLYREVSYSPRVPEEKRIRAVHQAWRHSLREWCVLWLRVHWRRLMGN